MPDMILGCVQCGEEQTSDGLKIICPNCGNAGIENFTLKGYPVSTDEQSIGDQQYDIETEWKGPPV